MPSRTVKGGKALTEYLEATKLEEPIFGDLKKHVLAKAYQPSGRRLDVMHPSEMIKEDWCHLAAYHRLRNHAEAPGRDKTTFWRENIFREGHCTHEKWQTWLAEMDRLAGDWKCLACNSTFWADETPYECPQCVAPFACLEYAEVPLNAEPLKIGGKADGYCPQDSALIEIKTLGLGSLRLEEPGLLARYEMGKADVYDLSELWKDFRRPLPSAVRQVQLYMYIARHFEDLPVERTVFFYDFKANQDTKSFVVPFRESVSEPLIEAATSIVDCLLAGTPPFCNVEGRRGCKSCLEFVNYKEKKK